MSVRVTRVLIVMAVGLTWLGGCSSSGKLSDLWTAKTGEPATNAAAAAGGDNPAAAATAAPASTAADATGTVNTQPAESAGSQPLASPGQLGDDPNDDLQRGKRYFRANNFGLAEKSFRAAVERHPRDAESWVDLAATYDRLHRFDLADRAYAEAIRLIGPTVEILNDQGFSYMLRGDYERARKKLREAQVKDPANPYVQANLDLLEESAHEHKAVQ